MFVKFAAERQNINLYKAQFGVIFGEEINVNDMTGKLTSFLDVHRKVVNNKKAHTGISARKIRTSGEEGFVVGEDVIGEDVFGLFSCDTSMGKAKNVYILKILEWLRHDF